MIKTKGKSKGATSFALISLKQLNKVFKEDAQIKVSRKFAEENGLMDNAVCVGHSRTTKVDMAKAVVVPSPKVANAKGLDSQEDHVEMRVENI